MSPLQDSSRGVAYLSPLLNHCGSYFRWLATPFWNVRSQLLSTPLAYSNDRASRKNMVSRDLISSCTLRLDLGFMQYKITDKLATCVKSIQECDILISLEGWSVACIIESAIPRSKPLVGQCTTAREALPLQVVWQLGTHCVNQVYGVCYYTTRPFYCAIAGVCKLYCMSATWASRPDINNWVVVQLQRRHKKVVFLLFVLSLLWHYQGMQGFIYII